MISEMFDWIKSKLSLTSEMNEAKKDMKLAKKEAKVEKKMAKKEAKREKKEAKKEAKRLKKEAKRLKKLAKQQEPEYYQPVQTDETENLAVGNREYSEKLSITRLTSLEGNKDDREAQKSPDANSNSSMEVVPAKDFDSDSGNPGIVTPDDSLAGGDRCDDKDGKPDRMFEADFSAIEATDSKPFEQEGAAMEDEPVVGDAKTVATTDSIAARDVTDDQGNEQVPTFQADFSAFDGECSLPAPEQKDTGRRVGRMTRSPSIPALGGVAADDPVHFVRHHRRFRIRRYNMAADPSFLWSLDWGAAKRKDVEKWEVQRVKMLDGL